MNWLKWQPGRQGSGYDKLLIATARWPVPWDCYLIRYREGSLISYHTDPVDKKKHFRLNVIVKRAERGGEFYCERAILVSKRIILFRPDISIHAVAKVIEGSRYVFSIGWVL